MGDDTHDVLRTQELIAGKISSEGDNIIINSDLNLENKNIIIGSSAGTEIGTAAASKIGFFGTTPAAQTQLTTGSGKTVDNVITLLQTLGLCRQAA